MEKRHLRPRMLAGTARRWRRPLVFVNQVGGHDDLVSTAQPGARRERRRHRPRRGARRGLPGGRPGATGGAASAAPRSRPTTSARRWARWCWARATTRAAAASRRALLGLSGGIDSALVACIAARRWGPRTCWGWRCPRATRRAGSRTDAAALAAQPGHRLSRDPDRADVPALPRPRWRPRRSRGRRRRDVTEENLQARVRGAILMALSNKLGPLLLTTGNKSEIATGYCTLYGDMCGRARRDQRRAQDAGLRAWRAPSTQRAARSSPSHADKPPSAELRPDQTDQDTLAAVRPARRHPRRAPGDGLDAGAGRRAASRPRWSQRGGPPWCAAANTSAARCRPGLKITGKAFGPGRRYPSRTASRVSGRRRLAPVPISATAAAMALGATASEVATTMKAHIAVLPGDGIGPEVTAEAAARARGGGRGRPRVRAPRGADGRLAIDATGTALPPETRGVCRAADAVLLGAVGGPKWDDPRAKVRPEQGLLGIRKELGLYANLRPVTVHPGCWQPRRCSPSCSRASTCWWCAS